MIFLSGFLSLFQIAILPGAIIATLIRSPRHLWPLSLFPLSLLTNYCLVYFGHSVIMGKNNQFFTYLFLVETTFLAFLFYIRKHKKDSINCLPKIQQGNQLDIIWFLMSIKLLIVFSHYCYGRVFTDWDAVVSWNRWAVNWYQGHFPQGTYWYPQLLPIIYSITYAFTGNEWIQLFARASSALFIFFTFFTLWQISKKINKPLWGILSSVIFYFLITSTALPWTGYADTPVSCLLLLSFLFFILGEHEFKENRSPNHSFLIGSSTALLLLFTKGNGVIFAFLYPLLWINIISKKKIVGSFIILLLMALSWYGFKYYQHEASNISTLSTIVGLPYSERIMHGFKLCLRKRHFNLFFLLSFCSLIASVILPDKKMKFISIITLLYFFIWCFTASYDLRNLSLYYPAASLIMAKYVEKFVFLITNRFSLKKYEAIIVNISRIPFFKISLLLFLLVFFKEYKNNDQLTAKSYENIFMIGEPQINLKLKETLLSTKQTQTICTAYTLMGYIPKIKQAFKQQHCQNDKIIQLNEQCNAYLIGPWCSLKEKNQMNALVKENVLSLDWSFKDYQFYTKIN